MSEIQNTCYLKGWHPITDIPPKDEFVLISDEQKCNGYICSSNELIAWQMDNSNVMHAQLGFNILLNMSIFTCWKLIG